MCRAGVARGGWLGALALSVFLLSLAFPQSQAADPATGKLKGLRVAILATDGFEWVELVKPRKALVDAGAKTSVVSLKPGQIKGWNFTDWGDKVAVDLTVDEAKVDNFDALLLPGGVINPDKLRMDPRAVQFARSFVDAKKPVASICHGPWTLVEADVVRGRKMTSWPSLKTDIKNAGGNWVDSEVEYDKGIITSRKPEDIPAFNRKMIEVFAEATPSATKAPSR